MGLWSLIVYWVATLLSYILGEWLHVTLEIHQIAYFGVSTSCRQRYVYILNNVLYSGKISYRMLGSFSANTKRKFLTMFCHRQGHVSAIILQFKVCEFVIYNSCILKA